MKGNPPMSRMQEQIAEPRNSVFVGVDVGKAHLDVFVHPMNIALRIDNTRTGIQKLVHLCVRHGAQLVAMEATGTYYRLAHEALHEAAVPVAIVNPICNASSVY